MQYLQPMQSFSLTRTTPSFLLWEAPVGQTDTQGGLSQCWHWTGRNSRLKLGNCPEFPLFQVIVGLILPQVVLVLAGDAAGIAADAFRLVDDHPVSCHIRLLYAFFTCTMTSEDMA